MTQRMTPFGWTRTRVCSDHALIGQDSHVVAATVNWKSTSSVTLISPAMGTWPRSPRFSMSLVNTADSSHCSCAATGIERLIYVLGGNVRLNDVRMRVDDFAWLPPDSIFDLRGDGAGQLLVFDKQYARLAGTDVPELIRGSLKQVEPQPFMGDSNAMLSTLLPTQEGFDMAVNVFTYQSGATLPFVETHIMEHGLYMRSGQGIYRLSESWYPVQKGDSIWMAAYCPQWFVAMGTESASYIYYKEVNRDPLAP